MMKRGYKQTDVGLIPEDWEVVKLISLSDGGMQNGLFYEVSRKGHGIKLVNVGDLYGTSPIDNSKLELFDANSNEIARFSIKDGDLFFTRSSVVPSGIAYCRWYKNDKAEAVVFDSHVVRLKTDIQKANPMFLFSQCVSYSSRRYFISNAKTATMTTIDQSMLGECPIVFPTLPEQEAIAEALSDADGLISSLEKLVAKKKAIKQGAMQQLLTGKKRLDGFSGERVVYELCELLEYEQPTKYIVKSTEYSEKGIPVLTAGKSFLLGYTNETEGIYNNYPVIIFDDFTTANKYVDFKFKVKSSAMKMLTLKNPSMNLKLIYELIQLIKFNLIDHQRYWISEYSKLAIKLPSTLTEQTAIANIFSDMDSEIEALEKKFDKYKQIKQGMLQELLTGRIRLVETVAAEF
jgi:type I restriction enzyme S subunit